VETGRYYFRKDLANMLETLVARDNLRNGELFGISGSSSYEPEKQDD